LFYSFCVCVGRRIKRAADTGYMKRIIQTVFALAMGIMLSCYGVFSLLRTQPSIFKSFYDKVFIAQNIGLLSFHSIDAFEFIKSKDNAMPQYQMIKSRR
jgi:hypothetical protein